MGEILHEAVFDGVAGLEIVADAGEGARQKRAGTSPSITMVLVSMPWVVELREEIDLPRSPLGPRDFAPLRRDVSDWSSDVISRIVAPGGLGVWSGFFVSY